MSKHVGFWSVVVVSCVSLFAGAARADTIRVTGAFTSFTGVVLGDSGPTFFEFCPGSSCGGGGTVPVQVCPDSGCAAISGIATNVSINGDPTSNTISQLFFNGGPNLQNALIFQSVVFAPNDPESTQEFKLGTLTFTNGIWTGDANFGFSIVAKDVSIGLEGSFDGFIHLALTPNATTATPQQNADFIYLTNAAGQPVVDPLTLKPLVSVRAYELGDSPTGSNSVSVDLFGKFGSLDLTRFDNVTGGGFLDVSLTSDLGGPPPPPPPSVPEPATLTLMGAGMIGLAVVRRRQMA